MLFLIYVKPLDKYMFRFYAVFRDGTVPIPLLPNRFNIFIATELSFNQPIYRKNTMLYRIVYNFKCRLTRFPVSNSKL